MQEKAPQYIKTQRQRFHWDWWRENPVELIVLVFIIIFFVFAPWEGCGISEQTVEPAEITVVP